MLTQLGPGVYRLGDEIVNSYLLVDGGEVTLVDAGAPAYWNELPDALASIGRSIGDVRALLLTHGHSDHIGFAERARRARIPVLVHDLDARFTADAATAIASLARIEGVAAAMTLPGHGAEWRAGPRAAIQLVRERGAAA